MANITIRNLDDDVKTRLRVRAADNGRFQEEEARLIPARSRRAQAEISESDDHHPVALRPGQGRGPGAAAARVRARAAVFGLSRRP